MEPKMILIALCVILGALFALDVVTTSLILSLGGIELNPVMVGIAENPLVHTLLKILVGGLFVVMAIKCHNLVKGSGYVMLGIPIVFYTCVVLNNMMALLSFY